MRIRNGKRTLTITSVGVLSAAVLSAALLTAPAVSAVPMAAPAAAAHLAPRTPKIVEEWAAAWNSNDPRAMANLFTPDGTYTDLAANFVSTGQTAIAEWEQRTDLLIADVHITITEAFRSGNHIAAETIYSGHINGAPNSFAVPATTIFELDGNLISSDRDYYNLATVLAQSGLPLTWTPPAG
ncbi:MAG TPA: nuclear transport factor 2 family protein [Streptosporangiaceae bacterium]|jgi:limonene-1,2-epoxide hydrolase